MGQAQGLLYLKQEERGLQQLVYLRFSWWVRWKHLFAQDMFTREVI